MNTRHNKDSSSLSIIDAVETLSNIADLEYDKDVGVSQAHDLVVQNKKITYRTVHWLHQRGSDETFDIVKNIFKVILNYLRNFYSEEYGYITNPQTIEGIKTIMVLVGEAAKKLDKYTSLFQKTQVKSVTDLKEYKKLQEFYLSRIARKIDEGVLGKWILELTKKTMARKSALKLEGRKSSQTKHVFIDLDSVKKDTEYELFFVRKEDGTRFYSPRLIRNIKLVSDFGDYFGERGGEDPLASIAIWKDRCFHACAKDIIHQVRRQLERFYHEASRLRDNDLIVSMNKCIMALMLCGNPHNLMHLAPIKSCSDYFIDFQVFLREVLQSRDYQKLIAYPPKSSSKLDHCLLDTIHGICHAFFTGMKGYNEIHSWIHGMIHEASSQQSSSRTAEKIPKIWSKLSKNYYAMAKSMKPHSYGPLNKLLNALQAGYYDQHFDPLKQENLPCRLYSLHVGDTKCAVVRIPCPIQQDLIHKANILEEFKAFLRASNKSYNTQKCLIFNLQDRTSWREHARSGIIEDLQNQESFAKNLTVITMTKDTEFYQQLEPYHQENNADVFKQQLKEHLQDESCGFFFSPEVRKALFPHFVDRLSNAIHQVFFSGKNVLPREHRLDFIEIFYLFLQLKVIEIVTPDLVTFTCKDAIDIGGAASAELFVFTKLLTQETLSEQDEELIDLMLYAPPLMIRERLMLPDRFNRMVSVLKCLESIRDECGRQKYAKIIYKEFGPLYKTKILHAKAAS